MDNTELKSYMEIQFAYVNAGIDVTNKHLARLNGQVKENTDGRHHLETDVAVIKTRLDIEGQHDDRTIERIEARTEDNRKSIRELVKQYGGIIMSVLLLLNMIGSWFGWFK